jgi:two-component system LytT family sensor kinase
LDVILGVLLGWVTAAALLAAHRLLRASHRIIAPECETMRIAVHAATATLPHLRRGLTREAATRSIEHLQTLVQAPAIALVADGTVLASAGLPRYALRLGEPLPSWCPSAPRDRIEADLHLDGGVPFTAAVAVPLSIGEGNRLGTMVAFYDSPEGPGPEDTRALSETAALVAAQLELAQLEAQGERLARAELQALRAQISPHFIYNALAAIARFTKTQPVEARELLTEFAEFTRYAFRVERAYVTLAEELRNVERYLRLEQARFGDRLEVRVDVVPEALMAVVPIFSLQPLVENAIRHGVEAVPQRGRVEIEGKDLDADVTIVVRDNGPGIDPEAARETLNGAGNGRSVGLRNVHNRLRSTFGPGYGIALERAAGGGTVARMTVPKFCAGVRAG